MKAVTRGVEGRGIHRRVLQALVLAFALAVALPALALGLGRIVVKSAPGQPLLAEIPVVSADPSELRDLRVRLASPETFRRVGLPAPDAATSNLQFTVAVDGRGRPVIRVTSAAPLRQPLLTFLIEVDWGAGRLVREYSVLLEAPSSLAAPAEPIQAPTVAAPNTIPRGAAPAEAVSAPPAPAPAPVEAARVPAAPAAPASEAMPAAEADSGGVVAEPLPPPPAPARAQPPAPVAVAPAPPPETSAPAPAPREPARPAPAAPAPAPAPATKPAPAAAMAHTVLAGETLSGIASGLDRGGRSLDQMMLALLQANPEAFIGGNINLVRAGAVLRAPSPDALERYSRGEAAALVRRQIAQWREAAAARMPASAGGAAPAPAGAIDAGRTAGNAETGAVRPGEARLQIVPPATGKGAGTQSGTQAGGEGTMLQQQIQESRETIAARDAEVGELKTRIAELEKIQKQQQQLISMKDTALAEARANLAKAQQAAVQAPQPASKQPAQDSLLWPWLLLALLVVAAGGWWWWRRRAAAPPRVFGMPPRGPRTSPAVAPSRSTTPDEAAPAKPVPSFAAGPAAEPAPAAPAPAPSAVAGAVAPAPEPAAPGPATPEPATRAAPAVPDWTAAPALVGTVPPSPLAEENASPARKVELARAYLDLGDAPAARALLGEAIDGRDPIAREIATRMLRELG